MALAQHLKVMVVDDMTTSRWAVTNALDQMGIKNVSYAKSGKEALSTLMAAPSHLVISDMNMPGLDGLGLLQELRNFSGTKSIGFILLTGSATKDVINRGRQLGMNNFMTKPFTTEKLKSVVEAVVGRLS